MIRYQVCTISGSIVACDSRSVLRVGDCVSIGSDGRIVKRDSKVNLNLAGKVIRVGRYPLYLMAWDEIELPDERGEKGPPGVREFVMTILKEIRKME